MTKNMLALMATVDSKFLQPGFNYKFEMNNESYHSTPSILHLTMVNGVERKYEIDSTTFDHIKCELLYINDQIEFERSLNGQDDELDDEA